MIGIENDSCFVWDDWLEQHPACNISSFMKLSQWASANRVEHGNRWSELLGTLINRAISSFARIDAVWSRDDSFRCIRWDSRILLQR